MPRNKSSKPIVFTFNCGTCDKPVTKVFRPGKAPPQAPKYCSQFCQCRRPRVRKTYTCVDCNALFVLQKKKHSSHTRCPACKQLSHDYRTSPLTKAHATYDAIRSLCRRWHADLAKLPCLICDYKPHVELCHIIPIPQFPEDALLSAVNARENVVQLCRNCHWEFDHGLLKKEQLAQLHAVQLSSIEPAVTTGFMTVRKVRCKVTELPGAPVPHTRVSGTGLQRTYDRVK